MIGPMPNTSVTEVPRRLDGGPDPAVRLLELVVKATDVGE